MPAKEEPEFWQLYRKYIDAKQALEEAEEALEKFIKENG